MDGFFDYLPVFDHSLIFAQRQQYGVSDDDSDHNNHYNYKRCHVRVSMIGNCRCNYLKRSKSNSKCYSIYLLAFILQFREAQARIEELETSNDHLQKRIDKLKNNRMSVINST